MEISQYVIVLVNLDPNIGSELQKTKPWVVISPDEMNHNLRTVVIAPMTTKSHHYPTRVKVKHNNQTGWIVMDQIQTIDKVRITKALGNLRSTEIAACKAVIKETFVD